MLRLNSTEKELNINLLVLYEFVKLSVYFSMKRTGSENLRPFNVGHGQKWQTALIVG